MELSEKEFLVSVSNPRTRKGYRFGLKKFVEWYDKPTEEILALRQEDLTQKAGENIVEFKNRAVRFEKEIEKFHSHLIEKGYSINSARNMTLGIRQLFRYYQMPVTMRSGSKVSQTIQTTKNYPLTIEHVRKMFEVANQKERTLLSLAVDTGLRISDFLAIQKTNLPPLDIEPPIAFTLLTQNEKITANCFLSRETIDLLKTYLPTLQKKNNIYLFSSNGESHISDEAISKMLNRLAEKAQIDLNGKSLSFHCFRKMFLSASIDSGIGLTAGKLMCGKAVPKCDSTYLTTVNLRQHFIQLKKFLTIKQTLEPDSEQRIESLKNAVIKLQEDLSQQKTITEAFTEKNTQISKDLERLKKQLVELQTAMTIIQDVVPSDLLVKLQLEKLHREQTEKAG